jgi:hypothetical protein
MRRYVTSGTFIMRVVTKIIEVLSVVIAVVAVGMILSLIGSPTLRETEFNFAKMLVYYGCELRNVSTLLIVGSLITISLGGLFNKLGFFLSRKEKSNKDINHKASPNIVSFLFAISHLLIVLAIYANFSYQWDHCMDNQAFSLPIYVHVKCRSTLGIKYVQTQRHLEKKVSFCNLIGD